MPTVAIICSPAEAEGMTRWAMQFALTESDEKLILVGIGVEKTAIQAKIDGWQSQNSAAPLCTIDSAPEGASVDELIVILAKHGCTLLIVGQNRLEGVSDRARQRGRALLDRATCTSILLRMESGEVDTCDRILIPSAGGSHSKAALQVGSSLALKNKGFIVPIFVEPEIGEEDGQAVGMRVLDRVLDSAGVDKTDETFVRKKVFVADSIDAGIREAAAEQSYDLLLVGASGSGTVRRKLFGTVPDRLLTGKDGMAVAVIRSKRSIAHRFRERIERTLSLRIPQLQREERITLFDTLQSNSRWSFDFMALMILATGIAALGLIQNSPAVVIGAMLVAPLMTPLLGSGLALVQGNIPLAKAAFRSICFGFLAALAVGLLMGWIAPIDSLTGELRARGGPTLLDMGVAFLSGIAASYCIARPNLSSALAGVAIAAALVPPIATVGISLALGDPLNARGAALLFGTNVVSIILGASLNFFAAGIRAQRSEFVKVWVQRAFIALLVTFAMLLIPLSTVLITKTKEQIAIVTGTVADEELEAQISEALGGDPIVIESIQIDSEKSAAKLLVRVQAEAPPWPSEVKTAAELAKKSLQVKTADLKVVTELVVSGVSE